MRGRKGDDSQSFQLQEFQQLLNSNALEETSEKQQISYYPSLKPLFTCKSLVHVMGSGPNANLESFSYLLLCYIRKEHYRILVNKLKEEQLKRYMESQESMRDRKVSFQGKGALFLNGPQYENYSLHKLRHYAFSSTTNLLNIVETPFAATKITSNHIKKLLIQFLKAFLPDEITPAFKQSLSPTKYFLNQYPIILPILTIILRYILYHKYNIQESINFNNPIDDYRVGKCLCQAFAIAGFEMKEGAYEVGNWAKIQWETVKSCRFNLEKQYFVQIVNDHIEEDGFRNQSQKKTQPIASKQIAPQQFPSPKAYKHSEIDVSSLCSEPIKRIPKNYSPPKQQSIMNADSESQIRSTCMSIEGWRSENKLLDSNKSISIEESGLRQTFSRRSGKVFFKETIQEEKEHEVRQSLEKQESTEQAFPEPKKWIEPESPTTPSFSPTTPPTISKTKPQCKIYKLQQKPPTIVNNNISNNIYLNISPQQVINISTHQSQQKEAKKQKQQGKRIINIALK